MKDTFNIPNILTYLRISLIPIFIFLFLSYPQKLYLALCVYVVASITDVVDGYIARKYNMITKIGKVLDPLADKLLKISALICFALIDVIPVWLVGLMFVLDTTMIITASVLFRKDIVIKSNIVGKLGTVVITLGLVLSFFYEKMKGINLYLLYIGLCIVVLSIISYIITYFKIKEEK